MSALHFAINKTDRNIQFWQVLYIYPEPTDFQCRCTSCYTERVREYLRSCCHWLCARVSHVVSEVCCSATRGLSLTHRLSWWYLLVWPLITKQTNREKGYKCKHRVSSDCLTCHTSTTHTQINQTVTRFLLQDNLKEFSHLRELKMRHSQTIPDDSVTVWHETSHLMFMTLFKISWWAACVLVF